MRYSGKISIIIGILCLLFFHWGLLSAQEFKVGTWKTAQAAQPFFYEKFLPETASISVIPFTNPADQKNALLAGSLDMCGTTLVHAIHSASRGQPVVVVAALYNKCSALVVRKNGPLASISDLKGKKIGYVPGTMDEILLRETLNRSHIISDKDVHLIRVNFFDMGMALYRGGIDAFLCGEPFPTLAVEKGYGQILSYPYYNESIGTINAGMMVTRKSIEETPERIYELVKAHAQATQYLIEEQEEWLKKAEEFGIPMSVLQKASSNMELAWEMDEAFVQKVKALGERMEALGVIQNQPDYDRLFDLSFVKTAGENMECYVPLEK